MLNPHQGNSATIHAHDRTSPQANLLTPMVIRGLTLPNRIAMSPMCQYVATDGFADDWHLVHLGSRAVGGVGLIVVEATGVLPEGRITPGCLGLWKDEHIQPLAKIVQFVHRQEKKIGIQLAHAGRKSSCHELWKGGKPLDPQKGGWPIVGPSAVPFDSHSQVPAELDEAGLERVSAAFVAAAQRAVAAGFDLIELHSAHGYLLHSFLSPLSNRRTDAYGGSLENRMRLLLQVAGRVRAAIPQSMPLFVRISATDWAPGGWDGAQSVELASRLRAVGVDLIDVSTGGLVPDASIPVGKEYQVPFAAQIRHQSGIATGALGLITDPKEANDIIARGDADIVFVGRQLLREPYWALRASHDLQSDPTWPVPYGYAVGSRPK